jgi:hypothetical protein
MAQPIDSKFIVNNGVVKNHDTGIATQEIVNAMKLLPQDSVLLDIGSGDGVFLAAAIDSLNKESKSDKYFSHVLAFEPHIENYTYHNKDNKVCCGCKTVSRIEPNYHNTAQLLKTLAENKLDKNSMLLCYPYCADEPKYDLDMIHLLKPQTLTIMVGYHLDGEHYEHSKELKMVTVSGSDQLWNQFISPLIKRDKDCKISSKPFGTKNQLGYSLTYFKYLTAPNPFEAEYEIENTLYYIILTCVKS